jgi:sigma-B regulation protein RsbU (phosphoserine phosphatase)
LQDPDLDEQSLRLPSGSTMLLYTDGITEAMDIRGELFGMGRLQDQLQTYCCLSAQSLCDRLVETVVGYQGDEPLHDDVTMVTVRVPL